MTKKRIAVIVLIVLIAIVALAIYQVTAYVPECPSGTLATFGANCRIVHPVKDYSAATQTAEAQ